MLEPAVAAAVVVVAAAVVVVAAAVVVVVVLSVYCSCAGFEVWKKRMCYLSCTKNQLISYQDVGIMIKIS